MENINVETSTIETVNPVMTEVSEPIQAPVPTPMSTTDIIQKSLMMPNASGVKPDPLGIVILGFGIVGVGATGYGIYKLIKFGYDKIKAANEAKKNYEAAEEPVSKPEGPVEEAND